MLFLGEINEGFSFTLWVAETKHSHVGNHGGTIQEGGTEWSNENQSIFILESVNILTQQ